MINLGARRDSQRHISTFELLQLRKFGFGLFEDGNIRVGIFPEG
jgi:hypothetical protein